ncbi:hypothetical protein AMAG_01279 [Allomyces macrogynus ATCC 38327]|uniref:Mini-chromosome maintenance complex-binding protein n=1 Tax=Allomyces macrogynus (strain ATCC 38327) TaxID=578462 RepID=A0A0L0RYB1_ALLM3|nr:hypothetical protein AMAG_01279 [Allomyces macrogynus ATCC 38327]|eukprot:KNE55382.1 hypothetical protein AMAG_01279 [Allomyces macrogynus ATCC 38327]
MAPLAAINDLLHDPRAWATQFNTVAATQAAVAQLFPTLGDVHRIIPSINTEPFVKLPTLNGRLVRFRGMVQDTSLSPQVYPLQWRPAPAGAPGSNELPVATQSGAWTDALPDAILSPATQILSYGDRQPVYLVSVPGEPISADLAFPGDTLVGSSKAAAKFPVPNAPHQAVVAKLYSPAPIEPRIGQVVEVVGVVEVEADMPVTVHVMWACELGKEAAAVGGQADVKQARTDLVRYLTSHLCGDEVAAEYVLLHLTMRGDLVVAQAAGGAGAMGIVAAAGLRAGVVTEALQKIGVAASWLPLSHDVLQKDVFAPRAALLAAQESTSAAGAASGSEAAATTEQIMDEPEGILAGRLQLAQGSVLVVDETAMTEGKLNEHAVRNLQALASVAQARVLPCEFPYSRVDLPIDYAILVVSESTKPLVPCQVRVPLASTTTATTTQLAPSNAASAYLKWVLSAPACTLGDDAVAKAIEQAYVTDRQRAAATGASSSASGGVDTCGQEQLHWQLALTRALGRSRGEATVTMDMWETVRAMEKTRIARLAEATRATTRTVPACASRAS